MTTLRNFKLAYLIFLIYFMSIPVHANQELNQINSSIVKYSISPFSPKENQSITIKVKLSNTPTLFNNLTLVYSINNTSQIKVLMINTTGINFEFTIPGQNGGSILKYHIELFYSNMIQDRAPDIDEIQLVIGSPSNNIIIQPGNPINIGKGNYTISDNSSSIKIEMSVSKAVEISLLTLNRTDSPKILNYNQISNLFNININDTESILFASLIIPYNVTYLSQINAIESRIHLLTREFSSDKWEIYPSKIDLENNLIIANVTHFSEWTVATSNAALRILDLEYDSELQVKTTSNIRVIGTNIGNVRAFNVSTQVFLPTGIYIMNKTELSFIEKLDPLQNMTTIFEFFADEDGTYTIVIVISGKDIPDNDIIEIKLEVFQVDQSTTSIQSELDKSSNTSSANFKLFSFVISFILFENLRRKRRKQIISY